MPKIEYKPKEFKDSSLIVIEQAREILEEYAEDGLEVTLRQLYYQFVARDLIANTQQSYKRIGSIISDAREAGLIDWDMIEDRTRRVLTRSAWDDPQDMARSAAQWFRRDVWEHQPWRVEVWVEKEALIGVIDKAAKVCRVPAFACKGYVSKSAMWRAGRRVLSNAIGGQKTVIVHLGDHDPSGIDMTRDIEEQVRLFSSPTENSDEGGDEVFETLSRFHVERIALNMDQVREHDCPPNPAKFTDSRCTGYVAEYGTSSWELDALDPRTLDELIRDEVYEYRDMPLWTVAMERERKERELLREAADRWPEIEEMLKA